MITPWDGADFAGAKLAALVDGHILTYRRDNKPRSVRQCTIFQ